jgi:pimeloyl-ACP methyl ester carboxylesterase
MYEGMNATSVLNDRAPSWGIPLRACDGPFFREISHQRVTANNGHGELATKTRMQNDEKGQTATHLSSPLGRPTPAAAVKSSSASCCRRRFLSRFGLIAATLAAAPAQAAKAPIPHCEKGAAQVMALGDYEKTLNALPREADCPSLKRLHECFCGRPIVKRMVPAARAGHTVNIAVFRTGNTAADRVVVFVHGALSDHETWQYIGGELGDDCELWLLDLPGCGESDGHPAHLEPDAFTPSGMAERVGIVLMQCLAERAALGRPAPRLTLAGHSLGGMYVLRLLSSPELRERFAEVRRHLNALVLFAPCDVAVNHLPPSFMPLLSLTPVKVGVGSVVGVMDDKVKAQTRKNFFLPECATRERAELLRRALTVPLHLRSAQAMVRGAVPWKIKENRPDWPAIAALEADYANVDVPCLIAWGEWDETISETMGHKIRDHVPGARLVEISGSGHSVVSEQPLACAEIIRTGQTAVTDQRFADLPPVCRYGRYPFDQVKLLARNQ